jgi:nitrogen-specific signal transduction histidine kinase
MALYSADPCAPAKHHMDGLEIAARMVGLAVERSRLEDQLRQANKMEAIGVLAGGIAHDFNNLLVTVLGNAELALNTLPDEAEATPLLNDIVTAGQSASELCDQILGYAGKRASATEPLECNSLVKELRGLSQVTLSKKTELTYDLEAEPLGILGDRSQLGQVIMNLTTNASEAIGDNCGRIVIGTRAETYSREELRLRNPDAELAPGDYVRLWVSDTGIGMPKRIQAKIFDPFFTTKPAGRGLGLAAVLGIIRGHKGLLTLDSEEGVGTTFSVLLPRAPVPSPALPPSKPGLALDRARILIVDDEAMVRRVLKRELEAAGHSVVCAADGQEGVDVFRREADSIDCVLLDLSMPKLDGEEVFRELRKIRRDATVILSSGYAEEEIIERFHGAELAGVLKKPFQEHELLDKVAAALCRTTS